MILNNSINAGNFIYCAAHIGPGENTGPYLNTGNGHHHQWSYVVSGSAHVWFSETPDGPAVYSNNSKVPGTLFDHRPYKDLYHHIKTTDDHLSFINFNPIPDTRNLSISMLTGPQTDHVITAKEQRITIVCITGPIVANGKELTAMQHAKLFPGKTATLTLTENSVCALVTEESDN
jgi:hypothetical protein